MERKKPEESVRIYRNLVEGVLTVTNKEAYRQAGILLRKMRPLLRKSGKHREFTEYVDKLRNHNRRRTNLLKVLEKLD